MAGNDIQHDRPLKIVLLSGGSGRTGERVLQSALAQFENPNVEVVVKPRIRSRSAALKVITRAQQDGAILFHTLVQPDVREAVTRECQRRDIVSVDLLGPTVSLLGDHLEADPQNHPGLAYELNKEQFDRLDAVDFTMAHDDGARLKDLKKADVVLVGVSRVSKSVTCFYLASRGVRAANVPFTSLHTAPAELIRLDPQRVIGLTMNASRLAAVRQARLDRISRRPVQGYSEQREVAAELHNATDLMIEHGWRRIDVSYKATEEIASEIIEMLPRRRASRTVRTRQLQTGGANGSCP